MQLIHLKELKKMENANRLCVRFVYTSTGFDVIAASNGFFPQFNFGWFVHMQQFITLKIKCVENRIKYTDTLNGSA